MLKNFNLLKTDTAERVLTEVIDQGNNTTNGMRILLYLAMNSKAVGVTI